MNDASPSGPTANHSPDRRGFLAAAAAGTAAMALPSPARAHGANDRIVAALMGAHNRGSYLAGLWAKEPNIEFAYVCDVDERAIGKGIEAISRGGQAKAPQGVKDFRQALDDKNVDVLICAAPDHWHASAAIMACAAGKHVYVEKPCSHNGREGELMIEAARKHDRVVQVGIQRRSSPGYQEAIEKIRSGAIGATHYARSWYNQSRPTIGHGAETAVPAWLDFDLWQGPAPLQPYRDNIVHYNWHFFWNWGTSELGNNGVHTFDICRWALGVDFPQRVSCTGGKYRFPDDDQETPDTVAATFDYGDKSIVWEGISWSPTPSGKSGIGIEIRGEKGFAIIDDSGYEFTDLDGKSIDNGKCGRGDREHQIDFFNAVRNHKVPNGDIEVGHTSTAVCHLGNIAFRTGRTLNVDPKSGAIQNDADAAKLWSREYRDGWAPQV